MSWQQDVEAKINKSAGSGKRPANEKQCGRSLASERLARVHRVYITSVRTWPSTSTAPSSRATFQTHFFANRGVRPNSTANTPASHNIKNLAPVQAPTSPEAPSKSETIPPVGASDNNDAMVKLRWKAAPEYTPAVYKELSKAKLSAFVVLTAMAGYALAPGAVSVSTLLWTTAGTALCSGAANAINQWIEAPYDAQMSRTRNRALVRHAISPLHAFSAGIAGGAAGVAILAHFVNPLTAALGASNIILYTCVYTPLKRTSIANTWAGAIVGAIPPMMGWAACTGSLDAGAWLLAAVLYAWQFPHFNSLSWNLRADYSKAGYRMMSVTDPALNARVSLRYSLLLFPLAWAAPYLGLTTWWFALDSSIINAVMAAGAWKFWRNPSDKTARTLFFGSLVHLPVILALLMIHKSVDSGEGENDEVSLQGIFKLLSM
ncbi:protoheme IX farnesyltransferase [Spizellomyces punctatus DAOM BR117]|uniref:Protoheme IX farnesyltransferase, mitochondrial n=1 Tax=Spizellomyces punctatus (strain DAOM BR117) TaxID=645134 RepID=A0A0L0HTZ4_SPIPD|nr:protoheme IX farnesyltransferase [Spizellomyces punctatus DAOM BR117]KND04821.1 protoheme IX farnesyltransferase [Spizellomyces punctatus DAOM BR117]|eukprot:XP_016612860.1 protoheme IX farnesyltransferase [Spizellomyces punctatus DAOM BR117]